ncbi:hypothetical protein ABK040_006047 [Willaertia magna]
MSKVNGLDMPSDVNNTDFELSSSLNNGNSTLSSLENNNNCSNEEGSCCSSTKKRPITTTNQTITKKTKRIKEQQPIEMPSSLIIHHNCCMFNSRLIDNTNGSGLSSTTVENLRNRFEQTLIEISSNCCTVKFGGNDEKQEVIEEISEFQIAECIELLKKAVKQQQESGNVSVEVNKFIVSTVAH